MFYTDIHESLCRNLDHQVLFPLEVVENIAGHLQDDAKALKDCSLVSPVWLSGSRHYLLRTVSVVAKSVGDEVFAEFCTSLQTSRFNFGRHVHHITLTSSPRANYTTPPLSVITETLSGMLSHFPQLRELYCKWITLKPSYNETHGESQVAQPPLAVKLDLLSMTGIYASQLSTLVEVLGVFNAVQNLVLAGISICSSDGEVAPFWRGKADTELPSRDHKMVVHSIHVPHMPRLSLRSMSTVWTARNSGI